MKQRRLKQKDDTNFKYLKLISLCMLIMLPTNSLVLVLNQFPKTCKITQYILRTGLRSAWYDMIKLYQLRRLYYCFANKQIHSDHGYPTWMFIILLTIIILLRLYNIIWPFITNMKVHSTSDNCYVTYDSNHILDILDNVLKFSQFAMDGIIIFLYLYKINKFTKIQESDGIIRRIEKIMHKIVLLAICYELYLLLRLFVDLLLDYDKPYKLYIHFLLQSFENIWVAGIVFLMIDHNEEYYHKCINCRKRKDITAESHPVPVCIDNKDEDTIYDTQTLAGLKTRHSHFVDQSEFTETVKPHNTTNRQRADSPEEIGNERTEMIIMYNE